MKNYRLNRENIGISICGLLFLALFAHLFIKLQNKGSIILQKVGSPIVAEGAGAYIYVLGIGLIGAYVFILGIRLEIKEYKAWKRNRDNNFS
jgi:hypothetical protein